MDAFFASHFNQSVISTNLTGDDREIYLVQLLKDKRMVVVKPVGDLEGDIHEALCDPVDDNQNEIPKHPNILDVEESIWLPGVRRALVLEYAPGGDLFNFIWNEEEYLEKHEVVRLFKGIASAVAWCHDQCVIHNDIKPENVYLTSQGEVKLADFGGAVWSFQEHDSGCYRTFATEWRGTRFHLLLQR